MEFQLQKCSWKCSYNNKSVVVSVVTITKAAVLSETDKKEVGVEK